MKTMLCAFTLLFGLPITTAWAECRAVDIKEFREATQNGPNRVVFFASWCSNCAQHLTADRIKDTIFVTAADDKAKAENVVKVYLKERASEASCFFDKDDSIANAFGVRNLPMEKSLSDLPKP